jgi:predicted secreted hydrolase
MRRCWSLLVGMALAGCGAATDERDAAEPNTGLRYLGGEAGVGFSRATVPREFVFPADHGSHPDYRTEWWYFTGNLATANGRHFGFELTFFRVALAPNAPSPESVSAWRANQVWMAHFAITDSEGGRFVARERLTRAAHDLAGATSDPLRVWVKDWTASGIATEERLSLRLDARDDVIALALNVNSTVPPIAQGDRGLDRKGNGEGNASYYYSIPRLDVEGQVTVANETFAVTGIAWLDREWSTSALEPGVVGWEWFALHLSDGSNLMFYRLRTAGGDASPFSGGTLVTAAGDRTRLVASDVMLTPLEHWTSEATDVRYPIAWRLVAPTVAVTLDVVPYLENQELDLAVRYWEGAVRANGRGPTGALTGQGYLELAGY